VTTDRDLAADAQAIWRDGLAAVDSARLVESAVKVAGNQLRIGTHSIDLDSFRRLVVVGAGKAGAGMAHGLMRGLGPKICQAKKLVGWVNVPDDCADHLPLVRLFGARPPGENLPTDRVLQGTIEILNLVRGCAPDDLCVCLISGGGSALLEAPIPPVTLADQIALIELLSAGQANIRQLNTIRKHISQVKAGRLAAACSAPVFSLIISDVIGDPLDVIASGPTCVDPTTNRDALDILHDVDPDRALVAASVYDVLRQPTPEHAAPSELKHVHHLVVGNIATAIRAAAKRAEALGYRTEYTIPNTLEGPVEEVAQSLTQRLLAPTGDDGLCAWIEGGEPVVRLAPSANRGLGGRNQQLILEVAARLMATPSISHQFCVLSGGTDGEDGPTDAAGALLTSESLAEAKRRGMDAAPFLNRNDSYHFFQPLGGLVRTGPTHTNVCDLRVALTAERG
jgi:hydroxypyruvate reductase